MSRSTDLPSSSRRLRSYDPSRSCCHFDVASANNSTSFRFSFIGGKLKSADSIGLSGPLNFPFEKKEWRSSWSTSALLERWKTYLNTVASSSGIGGKLSRGSPAITSSLTPEGSPCTESSWYSFDWVIGEPRIISNSAEPNSRRSICVVDVGSPSLYGSTGGYRETPSSPSSMSVKRI